MQTCPRLAGSELTRRNETSSSVVRADERFTSFGRKDPNSTAQVKPVSMRLENASQGLLMSSRFTGSSPLLKGTLRSSPRHFINDSLHAARSWQVFILLCTSLCRMRIQRGKKLELELGRIDSCKWCRWQLEEEEVHTKRGATHLSPPGDTREVSNEGGVPRHRGSFFCV